MNTQTLEQMKQLRFYGMPRALITGSTGSGKSYIASAIGHQACSQGFKVMYFNANKLFTMLKISKADGSYLKQINRLEKQDLLIIDDFGLKALGNLNRHSALFHGNYRR